MNNKVVFAAAGNGKTYSICKQAKDIVEKQNGCVLLISYTNEGIRSLEQEYRKQNDGILHEKVIIKSWYSFILSEFIKPYQCLLNLKAKIYTKEHDFSVPENFVSSIAFYDDEPPRWFKQKHIQYYINSACDVYPDRTSEFACLCNLHSGGKAISRIENIYTDIFIDELQDYAGWDLELIKLLFESKVSVTCVGDHKQATYRTNNSLKNSKYRDDRIRDFFCLLEKGGKCSVSYDKTTRRFNKEICNYINTIYNDDESAVEENIERESDTEAENIGVYIIDSKNLTEYCNYYNPVILRYNKTSNIVFKHECTVLNYGASKGATYDRTIIVPVRTVIPFITQQTAITSNQTRSKFYVACTRAKHSVAFAVDNFKENQFFKLTQIDLNGNLIPAFKFSKETGEKHELFR